MLLPNLAVIDDRVPRSAAMNMAIDEALLRTVTQPTLRAFRWRTNAVSFGYFDRYEEVRAAYPDRELVRRWTGGGVVDHSEDFTYSLVISASSGAFSSRKVYADVHSAIASALGSRAILASAAGEKVSGGCFANPVADDVLVAGRKVAGAAIRRTRQGLLLQGSVQDEIRPDLWLTKCTEQLAQAHGQETISDIVTALATALCGQRYATTAWMTLR